MYRYLLYTAFLVFPPLPSLTDDRLYLFLLLSLSVGLFVIDIRRGGGEAL